MSREEGEDKQHIVEFGHIHHKRVTCQGEGTFEEREDERVFGFRTSDRLKKERISVTNPI